MCLAVSAAVAAARLFKVQRVSLFLIEILLYKVYYILFLEEESVPWFSRHTHTHSPIFEPKMHFHVFFFICIRRPTTWRYVFTTYYLGLVYMDDRIMYWSLGIYWKEKILKFFFDRLLGWFVALIMLIWFDIYFQACFKCEILFTINSGYNASVLPNTKPKSLSLKV